MSLIPEYIKNLSPYKAGKPIEEVKRKHGFSQVIKLASNENPLGPSLDSIAAIKDSLKDLALYPDSSGYYLRQKLADKFDLEIDNVILGSGSEGIMSSIMRTFLNDGDCLLATENSFIGFRVLANASGKKTNWIPMNNYKYDLEAMSKAISSNTKIIYLANPDNPTGSYFSKCEFDLFMKKVPSRCLVIIDEAYFEFACSKEDYPDSMMYRYDNVITLRTFSKVYGLAGIRVGYGFANQKLISHLMKVKLPFEPSSVAQSAALAALNDIEHMDKTLKNNFCQMSLIEKTFKNRGLRFIESSANFITVVFDSEHKAFVFCERFLKEGIILRHLKSFGLPKCVRVSLGTKQEMSIFITKLDIVLSKK
ncbi:MAG: histidinol-phosphate transaminase [Pelagibacteraceae bacterium TMED124]|nr:histidinol-phosphate transaminase [Candidatus Neomarinimicrobiota bacterium]RPG18594.1 MAG: histidinol-phosphate transaminase [Pelagibacteraceae bacterium TMED124]|tara:strand:- start:2600 stop:3694 length:1095 start_codon:yes stop_codon:yes gene_type:complete